MSDSDLSRYDETDPYCYLASEYFASGEGQTICLYVARCYDIDDELESFVERFGVFGESPAILDRSSFLRNHAGLIPPAVARFLKSEEVVGDFVWSCEFHVNTF